MGFDVLLLDVITRRAWNAGVLQIHYLLFYTPRSLLRSFSTKDNPFLESQSRNSAEEENVITVIASGIKSTVLLLKAN
jgi:hypothetical protein